MTIIKHAGRRGVLAFGDSITNGGGELQWGVALQSWVQWVARGLGLPFTNYAVDGARAADVVREQLPAHARWSAVPDARYELGCLYIGVNDVRAVDWDAAGFERDFTTSLRELTARCDHTLVVTIPRDLGRPRAGDKVGTANTVILRAAAEHGALVLDLRDFGARNLLMADQVHPTAFGQIAIAEQALDVLAGAGFYVAVRPSTLIRYETTWRHRLQGDAAYAYRRLKLVWRVLRAR